MLVEIKSIRQIVLSGDVAVKQILETILQFNGLDLNQLMERWQQEAALRSGNSVESDDPP